MRKGLLVLTLVAALAAAAAAPAAQQSGTVVKAAKIKKLGNATILVTAKGMSLYMYVNDAQLPNSSACVDDPTYHCSKHWPPLLTTGDPVAGPGVQQALLGTITRPEGTMQVTYKGHPLYRYAGGIAGPADTKPGDVYGQRVLYIWYVVSPTGAVVKKKPKP